MRAQQKVNFSSLFSLSRAGRRFISKYDFDENISWIKGINDILRNFPEEQNHILINKFQDDKTISQLFDNLSEIMVWYRFINFEPEFIPEDNKPKPDIYVKGKNCCVEVKTLNNSDYETAKLKKLEIISKRNISEEDLLDLDEKIVKYIGKSKTKKSEDLKQLIDEKDLYIISYLVYKKAYEKINKSIEQLTEYKQCSKKKIVLVYNFDRLTETGISWKEFDRVAKVLLKCLLRHKQEENLNLSFCLISQNELFEKSEELLFE